MLEFMIAVGDGAFHFDAVRLVEAARAQWPGTQVFPTSPDSGSAVSVHVVLPRPTAAVPQLALTHDGQWIGLEAPTREDAAEVIAWLCRTADVPDDDTVVLIEWTDEVHPLSSRTTSAGLLALPAP